MRKGTCPICKKKFKWVSEHLIHVHGEERGSKLYKKWYNLDWNRYEPSPGKLRKSESPGHIIFSQGVDLRTMSKPITKTQCQVCGDFAHVNWAGRCSLCETAEREGERRRRK